MSEKAMKKSTARQIFTVVVAWILSFLLVLLAILGVLTGTVANQNYMNKQIQKSGFISKALENLNENYKSYGIVGNVPESVMTNIVTEEQIQKDMNRAVKALYSGDRRLIAHPEVAQAVNEAVLQNLQERKIHITDEIEAAVQDMANGCQADYDSYVQLMITPYLAGFMPKLNQMIWIGTAGLAVLTGAATAILCALQRKGEDRSRWGIYAILSAALFSIVLPLVFNQLVHMKYLNLKPETLKMLITSYTHNAVNLFFVAALIYLAVAAAVAIIWWRIAKRRKVR